MNRRTLIKGLPLAVGAGYLVWSKPALAVDPTYYTEVADGVVIVSPATASPGANWSLRTLQGAINLAQTARKPLNILPGSYLTSGLVISAPLEMYGSPGSRSVPVSIASIATSFRRRNIFDVTPSVTRRIRLRPRAASMLGCRNGRLRIMARMSCWNSSSAFQRGNVMTSKRLAS